jgi:hypothetical protein
LPDRAGAFLGKSLQSDAYLLLPLQRMHPPVIATVVVRDVPPFVDIGPRRPMRSEKPNPLRSAKPSNTRSCESVVAADRFESPAPALSVLQQAAVSQLNCLRVAALSALTSRERHRHRGLETWVQEVDRKVCKLGRARGFTFVVVPISLGDWSSRSSGIRQTIRRPTGQPANRRLKKAEAPSHRTKSNVVQSPVVSSIPNTRHFFR